MTGEFEGKCQGNELFAGSSFASPPHETDTWKDYLLICLQAGAQEWAGPVDCMKGGEEDTLKRLTCIQTI